MAGLSTIRVVDQPLRLPKRKSEPLKALRVPSNSDRGRLPSASVVYGIGAIALCPRAGLFSPPPGPLARPSQSIPAANSGRAVLVRGNCRAAGPFFTWFGPRNLRRDACSAEVCGLASTLATPLRGCYPRVRVALRG